MGTMEINFCLVNEKCSEYSSMYGFVSDSALIDASVIQEVGEGFFVDVPTPQPGEYYF